MKLFVGNTNLIELSDLRDEDGAMVSDADVEAVAYAPNGDEVDGQAWPLALDPIAGQPGGYRGVVGADAEFEPGRIYRVVIVAESDAGTLRFEEQIRAETRSSCSS